MSDEELFADFVKGRREALGELAARYEPAMLGLSRGLLNGRRDLASDAVQEAWMRVIRHRASFRGQSSFRTWLYRIVVNETRRLAARCGRAPMSDNGVAVDRPDTTVDGVRPSSEVRAAVAALDHAHREVVLLCYHAGLTHSQVAEILQVPVGTVKSRLHAALNGLRDRLGREVTCHDQ